MNVARTLLLYSMFSSYLKHRNVALLSFGDEASEFEDNQNLKIKSSHDLVENDPRLSKEVSVKEFEIQKSDHSTEVGNVRKLKYIFNYVLTNSKIKCKFYNIRLTLNNRNYKTKCIIISTKRIKVMMT